MIQYQCNRSFDPIEYNITFELIPVIIVLFLPTPSPSILFIFIAPINAIQSSKAMMKQKLATMISRIENKEQWDELIAQLDGRLLFIDVHKEWAGPCSIMQGQLENIFLNTEAIESRLQFCSVHEKSGVRPCNSTDNNFHSNTIIRSPQLHHCCTTAAPLLHHCCTTTTYIFCSAPLLQVLTASHHHYHYYHTTTTITCPTLLQVEHSSLDEFFNDESCKPRFILLLNGNVVANIHGAMAPELVRAIHGNLPDID